MRAFFLVLVVVAGAALLGWTLFLLVRAGVEAWKRHSTTAAAKERADVPWTAYARPDANGDWRIGVERVHCGTTLEQVEMFHMPPPLEPAGDVEVRARLLDAQFRAQTYNDVRTAA